MRNVVLYRAGDPVPPKSVTFYAEDHYDVPETWKDKIAREQATYDVVFNEDDADEDLIDDDLIPRVNMPADDRTTNSGVLSLRDSSTSIPFDVRHTLNIPIHPDLATILVSAYMCYGNDIVTEIEQFLVSKFVRNLLQPEKHFLNMIARLSEHLTTDEYSYVVRTYHDVQKFIKEKSDEAIKALHSNKRDPETFNKQIEVLMFHLPAMLSDVYAMGLIMSQKGKNVMVVCGAFHARNIKERLDSFYNTDSTIVSFSE